MAEFDPTSSVETWHPIPSLHGFELSNHFRVRRHTTISGFKLPGGPVLDKRHAEIVCKWLTTAMPELIRLVDLARDIEPASAGGTAREGGEG
jgi:hypothetical protein